MAIQTYITHSAEETQKIGEALGKTITPPQIIAFTADLGGGKTTFIQGLAKGLGIKSRVNSPTFVLEKIYPIPKKRFALYHYDVYRLAADPLLTSEILENARTNIVTIEWAEKIKKYLPIKSFQVWKLLNLLSNILMNPKGDMNEFNGY